MKFRYIKKFKHYLGNLLYSLAESLVDKPANTIQQNIRQLKVIRSVDNAIINGKGIKSILSLFCDQVAGCSCLETVCVLLTRKDNENLEIHSVGEKEQQNFLQKNRSFFTTIAQDCMRQKQIIQVDHIDLPAGDGMESKIQATVNDSIYFCAPIIIKNRVIGVLGIFRNKAIPPDENWFSFLKTLAVQGALAIEFEDSVAKLKKANAEMATAYDSTLTGWAKALELRDNETEGHSQRVIDKTMLLAALMGIRGEALVQMRRGALLHDIGKMGISDEILHKPGRLDNDEWEIVKKHPLWAYELLSKIPFLESALDIPLYHHEKWDGSGYPAGLKGTEIPLSARIFAVADVWDALRSDRPYSKAWSERDIIQYFKEQAGIHFDPQVIEVFVQAMEGESITHYQGVDRDAKVNQGTGEFFKSV